MKAKLRGSFISMRREYNKVDSYIPQPLLRREFCVHGDIKTAEIYISSLGYYELHVNGRDVTKGAMAPYRSNPLHFIYFDRYDIMNNLTDGENCIGVILGNGFQNSIVETWNFNALPWASAPAVSFVLRLEYSDGSCEEICSDSNVKCADSPIIFNDFHYGEYYDACLELQDWDKAGFSDSDWTNALCVDAPAGELVLCESEPIVVKRELSPISIAPFEDGFVYDFGENNSGVCRLKINGKAGQKLILQYFETLKDGKPYTDNLRFQDKTVRFQEQEYTCKEGTNTHIPRFTYFGFRYVYIRGVAAAAATPELLTYLVMCSDIEQNGTFYCDNEIVNRIQEATVRSDFSNFYYFPTDCPHREKNGWTADAALSAEQMILNITPQNSYREWLRNIYKAMKPNGQLPGIIPTAEWGYEWGNGPAWDNVIVYLPYYTYKYYGDKQMLEELSGPLMKYLRYLESRLDSRGLMEIGLGDWSEAGEEPCVFHTPLVVTDSILTLDIAEKAAFFYDILGMTDEREYAKAFVVGMKSAIRKHLINYDDMTVFGNTQTAQAMGIYYGIFEHNEKQEAVSRLVELIHENGDFLKVGVLGGRILFRVLSSNGYGELAYRMITRPEFPSYANWIARGATTLFECFDREGGKIESLNHHFWGDVSAWFYTYICGVRYNPSGYDHNEVCISPLFLSALSDAKCSFNCKAGKISSAWKREGNKVLLNISVPNGMHGEIILPKGYIFENGERKTPIGNGVFGAFVEQFGNDIQK